MSIVNSKRPDGSSAIRVEVYENEGEKKEKEKEKDEPSKVFEERSQGVERELEHFVRLVSGEKDGGYGTLEGALSDVAFIEAGLTSEGKPIQLI